MIICFAPKNDLKVIPCLQQAGDQSE